mmetsp:Transcript_17556/g.44152  ORF Transcript_17556/g.44152 Transcript_17556/m.44152 type:complete len:260 (-) Transcript_17556:2-781(-)
MAASASTLHSCTVRWRRVRVRSAMATIASVRSIATQQSKCSVARGQFASATIASPLTLDGGTVPATAHRSSNCFTLEQRERTAIPASVTSPMCTRSRSAAAVTARTMPSSDAASVAARASRPFRCHTDRPSGVAGAGLIAAGRGAQGSFVGDGVASSHRISGVVNVAFSCSSRTGGWAAAAAEAMLGGVCAPGCGISCKQRGREGEEAEVGEVVRQARRSRAMRGGSGGGEEEQQRQGEFKEERRRESVGGRQYRRVIC